MFNESSGRCQVLFRRQAFIWHHLCMGGGTGFIRPHPFGQAAPASAQALNRSPNSFATSIQDQIPKFEITTLRTQNDVRSAADALPVSILDLRTEKARNCLSPNGLHRRPTCASDSPCFRAAVPIWEGNRGNSRGHPRQSPHDVVSGAHPDDQPIVRVSYHPSALPGPACARTGKFTASPSPS